MTLVSQRKIQDDKTSVVCRAERQTMAGHGGSVLAR